MKIPATILLCLLTAFCSAQVPANLKYERLTLPGETPVTLELAYVPGFAKKYTAILMLGTIKAEGKDVKLPDWSLNLINEGYMLAAFTAVRPPDPDTARRPKWLVFDQRFANMYAQMGKYVPQYAGRVIDYLQQHNLADKFGWVGSSSTGIPGLAVATREPRLGAVVAFVSTGAYCKWLQSWQTNKLWSGKTNKLWPETEEILAVYDPILQVKTMFPCAVLMVSGGSDKVVDAKTAHAFTEAAKPYYTTDPERLRLVIYDEYGHNLPHDIVPMYVENWLRLYLHPVNPPPKPLPLPQNLNESVKRSSVTGAEHKKVMQGN